MPDNCACKHEDPVTCAISFGHGAALKYCYCRCHAPPSSHPAHNVQREKSEGRAIWSGMEDDGFQEWQAEGGDELC